MNIDKSIFKAYDIRGTVPDQLNPESAKLIAHAFARLISEKSSQPIVVVSRDMRLSSPEFHSIIISELMKAGINVVDIGLASTPTFYFAVAHYGYDGGIQITASHNPKEYNGFKMVRSKAVPIGEDSGIKQMYEWASSNYLHVSNYQGKLVNKTDILNDLIDQQRLGEQLDTIKPYKIVVDTANSMGILDSRALFAQLSCQVKFINEELDGTFPSHEPDPLKPENLTQLQQTVIDEGADLGIALDGDADRIFIVMDNGEVLKPEILRGILAQIVLQKYPGSKIGFDIRPGKITKDMIENAGGIPFVTKVGHSLIKAQMIKMDSPFSGESSGHFFYRFAEGSYDAPMAVITQLLTWLSQKNEPLSKLAKPYDIYFHSGEINFVVRDIDQVLNLLRDKYADANDINYLDGISITYDTYWFNVRGSNTEPKVRLNLEAIDQQTMESKRDEISQLINSAS